MSETPATPPTWTGPAEFKYANAVTLAGSAFDVQLIFGLAQPPVAGADPTPVQVDEVVRVSMSWGHVKSMIPMLAKMVADYESKFGEVPSPGFENFWKV